MDRGSIIEAQLTLIEEQEKEYEKCINDISYFRENYIDTLSREQAKELNEVERSLENNKYRETRIKGLFIKTFR